jgi:CheY-like chemotaxis protein
MCWFRQGNPLTRFLFSVCRGTALGYCSMVSFGTFVSEMTDVSADRMPDDVLIVEDDPIIALDFEDTILGFGVKTVRTAGNVTRALELIAERAPDFALLDVGLVREKSFAVAEQLDALGIRFAFVTGYGADVRLPAAFARKAAASQALFGRCTGGRIETVVREVF